MSGRRRQVTTPTLTRHCPSPAALVGASVLVPLLHPSLPPRGRNSLAFGQLLVTMPANHPLGIMVLQPMSVWHRNAVPPSSRLAAAVCSVQRWVSSSQAAGSGAQVPTAGGDGLSGLQARRPPHVMARRQRGCHCQQHPHPFAKVGGGSAPLNLFPLNCTPSFTPATLHTPSPGALQKREKGLM